MEGRQEGHPTHKNSVPVIPGVSFLQQVEEV